MIKEVTAMAARHNLGELLNEVKYRHDNILITKAGKPVAALIDVELFNKVKKMKEQFAKLTAELGDAYKAVEHAEAQTEIDDVIKTIREEQ